MTVVRPISRLFRRAPLFAIGTVLVVSLGVAVSTAVFALAEAILGRPLPYPTSGELFAITPSRDGGPSQPATMDAVRRWDEQMPNATFSGIRFLPSTILGDGESGSRVGVAEVDSEFFRVLGMLPDRGAFTAADFDPRSGMSRRRAVVTQSIWRRYCAGLTDPSGCELRTSSELTLGVLEVAGVMPPEFVFPSVDRVDLILAAAPGIVGGAIRVRVPTSVVGRIQGTGSVDGNLIATARSSDVIGPTDSLRIAPLNQTIREGNQYLFSATQALVWGLVLLIGWGLLGLTLMWIVEIREQLALRHILGAPRIVITGVVLREVGPLVLLGIGFGVLLAKPLLVGLTARLPGYLVLIGVPGIDWHVVGLIGVLCLSVLGLMALAITLSLPTMQLATLQPQSGRITRRTTAVAQVVIACSCSLVLVFAIMFALIAANLRTITSRPLGYELDRIGVATVRLSQPPGEQTATLIDDLLEELAAIPGIQAVGVSDSPILSQAGRKLAVRGQGGESPDSWGFPVTAGFFSVLKPELLRGTLPDRTPFRDGEMVVSESLARMLWPSTEAIGRTVLDAGSRMHVLRAVVKDPRFLSWQDDSIPALFVPYRSFAVSSSPLIVFRGDVPYSQVALVISRSAPTIRLVGVAPLRSMLRATVVAEYFYFWLFGLCAMGAGAMLLVLLVNLTAMQMAYRRREVAVRIAVGAQRLQVVRLLMRDQFWPLAIGIVGGVALSWWAVAGVRRLAGPDGIYQINIWFVAAAAIVFVSFAGSLISAWRLTGRRIQEQLHSE